MENNSYFTLITLILTLLLREALTDDPVARCPYKSSRWLDLGGNSCYLIESNETVPWMEAVYRCFREGGSLASFHSHEEVQRVVNYARNETSGFYIGLWKNTGSRVEWVDKSVVDYTNWFPGEPNLDFEKCVEMYVDNGKWNDLRCDEEFGYVCSAPKGPPPRGPRKECPGRSSKWLDLGGDSCYIIETGKKATWRRAERRCAEAGGHLASFHSIGEISAVLQRTKTSTKYFYIGLLESANGQFMWTDNNPMNLSYWKSSPDTDEHLNNVVNRCGKMNPITGRWLQTECVQPLGYICSTPKVAVGMEMDALLREMPSKYLLPKVPGMRKKIRPSQEQPETVAVQNEPDKLTSNVLRIMLGRNAGI